MAENIEETNARRWEVESEISVAPSRHPPSINLNGQATAFVPLVNAAVVTQHGVPPAPRPALPTTTSRRPQQSNLRGNNVHFQSRSGTTSPIGATKQVMPGLAHNLQNKRANDRRDPKIAGGRRDGGNGIQGNSREKAPRQRPRQSPDKARSSAWAEPPALLTSQRQREKEAKEWERKLREIYFQPLEENAGPFGVGYYLWHSKDTTPMDLLGWHLKELNPIRAAFKVWIDWQETTRTLRISSRSELSHEKHILQAIKAIRDAVGHAKAKAISSSPVYIAIVPTSSGMRSIVRPTIVETNRITGLELAGAPLPEDEKATWKKNRLDLVKVTRVKFEEYLVKNLLDLAPYKGWMRLRVHFGHVEFSLVHNNLKQSKYSFMDFSNMLKNPRTTGRFQRQLENATLADNVKKRILAWPMRFCPVEGLINDLEDVKFRDTEVVFVTTSTGGKLRLEADVDRIKDGKTSEYQIGGRRLFHDSERNKKMEITMIDVEKRVDWALEVITDNSIEEWPSQLTELINNSVAVNSPVRGDTLGLSYPGVSPGPRCPYGVIISKVVVRSVIHYLVRDSGYIIEIAIYRTWEGDNTSEEPKMASSVSLYHPSWDLTTESIEMTTKVRGWDKSLSHFFDNGDRVGGLQTLMDEIGTIQGFLSAAQLQEKKQEKKSSD